MISSTLKMGIAVAVGAIMAFGSGAAAKTTMNLGFSTPLDTIYGEFAKKFKELAEEYTDGEVEVKLRPSGQIAGEDEAFKALQLGTVDAYQITLNNVSPHFPLMDVFVLPYIFTSIDHAYRVMDGEVGDEIKSLLNERTGVHLLSYNRVGFRDMYNTAHPIDSFEDMEGLKLRVPKNEVMLATFRAFGAEPVPLAWSETPTALQTGTIDGGDNGTEVILSMKFFEFAENLTILESFGSAVSFFVSDRFMSRLSDEDADAIRRAAKEAEAYQREIGDQRTGSMRQALVDSGMKMTRPDKAPFIEAARQVQDDVAGNKDDEFRGIVARIREVE